MWERERKRDRADLSERERIWVFHCHLEQFDLANPDPNNIEKENAHKDRLRGNKPHHVFPHALPSMPSSLLRPVSLARFPWRRENQNEKCWFSFHYSHLSFGGLEDPWSPRSTWYVFFFLSSVLCFWFWSLVWVFQGGKCGGAWSSLNFQGEF